MWYYLAGHLLAGWATYYLITSPGVLHRVAQPGGATMAAPKQPQDHRKPLAFKTAKRRKDPIPFDLDGEEYTFTPPKNAMMVLPMIEENSGDAEALRGMFDWLGAGLSQEEADRILERLKDPQDDLDFDTVAEVIEGLMEEIGGRPTT